MGFDGEPGAVNQRRAVLSDAHVHRVRAQPRAFASAALAGKGDGGHGQGAVERESTREPRHRAAHVGAHPIRAREPLLEGGQPEAAHFARRVVGQQQARDQQIDRHKR